MPIGRERSRDRMVTVVVLLTRLDLSGIICSLHRPQSFSSTFSVVLIVLLIPFVACDSTVVYVNHEYATIHH